MPLLPTHDPGLFRLSLAQLIDYKTGVGRAQSGRFVQLFLGLKFYQNTIPSMFSGNFVSTEVLQTILDNLYARQSLPATECVLMLFEDSYLARTGLVGPGNSSPQNTWRNNFNLQKGIGCYASPTELSSPTFLAQSRALCPHLVSGTGGGLSHGRCALCPTGATYRREDHPKWLRIDPGGGGYAVADMMNVTNFTGLIAPGGNRIPVMPLIIALYHDALPSTLAVRPTGVDIPDFMTDFSLSAQEFSAYFDDAPSNPNNRTVLAAIGSASPPPPILPTTPTPPFPTPTTGAPIPPTRLMVPILSSTPVPPPAVLSGWPAEEYAREALVTAHWTVYNVSRQQVGYDLLAQKGRRTVYVEVKSSLGYCTPRFTEREWQMAAHHGQDYVLAVVENYNPSGTNGIFWIPNPAATLTANPSLVRQFSVSRTAWQASAVPISRI